MESAPSEHINRLINEKSPYLNQHAHNPVDWYPWSDEAFDKAKSEDKPVFLSVGYSTCHWCHVMAHESFEDQEVADILNKHFVSVKVDREERPDIDAVYMKVCQAMTGSGGWPMTILMTPDKHPFFAGTYFPKTSKYGSAGLIELLMFIKEKWETERGALEAEGSKLTELIKKNAAQKQTGRKQPEELIEEGRSFFRRSFDETWGGFGRAPKFPAPHNLLFLLKQQDTDVVEKTLIQMYRGGIFDHVGGGFSRYATDEMWLVPHFEKMLYDNALLIYTYSEAYGVTGKELYQTIAQRTAAYVLKELTHPLGGFYCGQDADSEGVEGKYYVFTPEEVKRVLGRAEGADFCNRFDITEEGNFEGKSIPNLINNPNYEQQAQTEKLYEYRLGRVNLHKDDKILTSWNGLMIAALVKAGYTEAAQRGIGFIWENLRDEKGDLFVRWRDGDAVNTGQLDDYAFLAFALLECYRVTLNVEYLEKAVDISEKMVEHFFDEEEGGCYLYSKDAEQLIFRPKEVYDGAIPSGNSMAALVMVRLFQLTGKESWRKRKEKQMAFLQELASDYPAGQSWFLYALSEDIEPSAELVCVSKEDLPAGQLRSLPVTVIAKSMNNCDVLEHLAPFTKEYPIPEQGVRYYLCRDGSCSAPVERLEDVSQMLTK